ncbi:MFS transporter [Ancylomarina sp. 16SWW S1-10-2]|uniref:MFS transporter n=1 Tax=Ancylomarina sp. 16SWW S1-10-2 TaxID=2499681 RepID=UPI0012ADCBE1|nr:MFS transporter [Ancylomarina sp. 16SWW S1-10-2]MRT93730.1 MFS transporter [Ancylomarina sp. 16SWW S1-10-2]
MTDAFKRTLRDSSAMRWAMLILLSGLTFSTYWFQDFFSGLKGLMESEMGFSSEEFGRILALTTSVNIFGMIIVGGIMLDKWGIRIAGIVFGGIAVVGGAISALAASGFFGIDHDTMLNMIILGRILFGSGLEVICVVATRTIVKWFKGYELALAMAINMGIGRLGSAMGTALSLDIGGGSVSPAVTFAATLMGLTLIMFLIYAVFDVKLDKQETAISNEKSGEACDSEEDFKFSDLISLLKNKSFLYISLLCVSFYAAIFPFMQYAPDLLINKFGFSEILPTAGEVVLWGSSAMGAASVYIVFFVFAILFAVVPNNFADKQKRLFFKVGAVVAFTVYLYIMKDVLSIWLDNGAKTASLIPLGTIIFTPIFGNIVDKKGKAASLMILGSFLVIFAHLSLSVMNNVYIAYLGLLSLGVAFSLVPAAMWPSVAKIVAENRLGTAYASMATLQNWGLAAFFYGIGALLDYVNQNVPDGQPKDYTIPILLLVGCGVISIFLSVLLKKADKEQNYGLEDPS